MSLLKLLRIDVRAGEVRSASAMVLHSFFMGATTVFFETAASALFLSNFDAAYLPFVYLAASGISIVTGAAYDRLRKTLSFSTLMSGTLLFLAGLIGTLRVGLSWFEAGWLFFSLMVAYRLISILTDLEFWSVAARLYDVRQSKRLFGIIGSGEVLARIIGSFSIPLLLRYIEVRDLIWISGVSLILCLATLLLLFKLFPLIVSDERESDPKTVEERTQTKPSRRLFDDPYLRPIYLLALFAVLGKYFIDFAFLSQLQTRHVDVTRLASFFAVFSGSTQILNLLIRVFVSGKLLSRFGLRTGLLILPLAHVICTVATLGFFTAGNAIAVFWLVILNQGLYKTLKHPIDHPAFKILYQPLQRSRRLGAQINVEVIVTPIAIGIAALFMIVLGQLDFAAFAPLMLADFVFWVFAASFAYRGYSAALIEALGRRNLDGMTLNVSDTKSLEIVRSYIRSDDPGDVLFALDLLERSGDRSLGKELISLFVHPSPDVRRHALLRVEALRIHEAIDAVSVCFEREEQAEVKAAAIRAFCVLERRGAIQLALRFLDDPERIIRRGALIGLLRSGREDGRERALARLRKMVHSPEPARRLLACEVFLEVEVDQEYLLPLLSDTSLEVQRAAVRAARRSDAPDILRRVVTLLDQRSLRQEAFETLLASSAETPVLLSEALENKELSVAARIRIARLCGRVSRDDTCRRLWAAYSGAEQELRSEILKSLTRLDYRCDKESHPQVEKHLNKEIQDGHWKLGVLPTLKDSGSTQALEASLREEVERNRNRALYLISFLLNERAVLSAKSYLDNGSSEKRAYAKELLEVHLPTSLRERIWPILHPDTAQTAASSRGETPGSRLRNNMEEILERGADSVTIWTKACALYSFSPAQVTGLTEAVRPLRTHRSPFIREAAEALERNEEPVSGEPKMLTIEKVMLLKRVEMFALTSEDILTEVADILEEVTLKPGEPIIRKGDMGTSMYIVIAGRVKVFDGDKIIGELGPREMFGELALLDPEPRSASVDAVEETRLFRLDRDTFFELLEDNIGVVSAVMQVLCQRLRRMTIRAMSGAVHPDSQAS